MQNIGVINMKTQHLRDFLAVARYLNFASAADATFISASVLSKHIASLEDELNIKLFNRTTRSVTLTEYGKKFVQYAAKITETENAFLKVVTENPVNSSDTLRILAIPVILHYGVAEKIALFRTEHHEVNLQIIECQPLYLEEEFKKGIYDVAICGRPIAESNTTRRRIAKSNLVAVMKYDHPRSGMKQINIEQLRDENILLQNESTYIYEACMKRFTEAGITPREVYRGIQQDIILKFVSAGMGVALMVKQIVEYYGMENICFVNINPKIDVFLDIVWDTKKPLKPLTKLLIQFLTESTEDERHFESC